MLVFFIESNGWDLAFRAQCFANFKNGMEILKQVLTQLLLYYSRFTDNIVKKCFRNPPWAKDIVAINTIMYEIKKYSRQF